MASTTSLPVRSPRHPALDYGQHPDLGDFTYSATTDSWTNRRITSEGQEILLYGQGRRPSEAQVRSWWSIEAHLEDLIAAAVAVVPPPSGMPRRYQFLRQDLSLREVRVGANGEADFFLDTPLGGKLNMWPMVTFQNHELIGCQWVA